MDGPFSSPSGNDLTHPTEHEGRPGPSRRNLVLGASVVGAAGLLSACGGSSSSTASSDGSASATATAPSASSSADDNGGDTSGSDDSGSDDSGGGSGGGGGGEKLASTSEVPVGGGTINKDAKVVITQPTAGTFKAFSAVCTHMNCLVTSVSKNLITCTCHGSTFSATDGSVQQGPAPSPLPAVAVTVNGDDIDKA